MAGEHDVTAPAQPRGRQARQLRGAWSSLIACTCATAVLQLDGTMVTAAVPALSRELAVDNAAASWVLIAYFAPFALLLLPGGRLTDQLGARRVALLGLLVFAAGAAVGAVAPDFALLVASRALQGIAAGLISPAALTGAVSGFPAHRRGGAIGLWGAGSGTLSLAGPLLGGFLVADLGWRSAWWSLLVIAALVGAAIARYAPDRRAGVEPPASPDRRHRRVLGISMALTGGTFLVLVLGFLIGQEYLQQEMALSALAASETLLVAAVTAGLATPLSGWMSDHLGNALPMTAGLTLLTVALALLGTGVAPLHAPVTLVLLVAVGGGFGLVLSPTARAALGAVAASQHGRVSAWLSVGRIAGGAAGAGIAGIAGIGGLTPPHIRFALLAAAAVCAAGLPLIWPLRRVTHP